MTVTEIAVLINLLRELGMPPAEVTRLLLRRGVTREQIAAADDGNHLEGL